jgi:hypothetical protein
MLEALAQLDDAFTDDDRRNDPRYFAARGSVKLAWYTWAQRVPDNAALRPAPTLPDCLADLHAAHATVLRSDDLRLQCAIENNICFATCLLYEAQPSPAIRIDVNDSWSRLVDTLYQTERDVKRWPVRIIDTVALGIMVLKDLENDSKLLEDLVDALERRHKTELAGEEKELIAANLRRYRDMLAVRKTAHS